MSTFVLAVCTLIIAWLLLKPATQTSEYKEDDQNGHPLLLFILHNMFQHGQFIIPKRS